MGYFRSKLIDGFLLLLPAAVTFLIVKLAFDALDGLPQPIVEAIFGEEITGLGLVIVVFLALAMGIVTSHYFGLKIWGAIENSIERLPTIGTMYATAKQVAGAASSTTAEGFSTVVSIRYPRDDLFSIGFLTRYVEHRGERMAIVYVPSTPVPNTGFFVIAPESQYTILENSPAEVMRMIVSAGVSGPAQLQTISSEPSVS